MAQIASSGEAGTERRVVPGRFAYRSIRIALGAYAGFELASIPFAWLATDRLNEAVVLDLQGVGGDAEALSRADTSFRDLAAVFYLLRAIAEIGLVVGFVAGLFWLHNAWARSRRRAETPTITPRAVVLWTLVPVWGLVRLHGTILQIAKWNGVRPESAHVDRWWWTLIVNVIAYFAALKALGWGASISAVIAAASALFGMQMVRSLQIGLERSGESNPL